MTQRLGIALLPRADQMRLAIRVQRELGQATGHVRGLRPLLSLDGNLPHLTVLQGHFGDDGLLPSQALMRVVRAVRLPSELRLRFGGFRCEPPGWVFLSLVRTPLLARLQEAALAVLASSHACGSVGSAGPESCVRDGYRYTGDAYRPHLTLARTADEESARELVRVADEDLAVPVPGTWVFDRLSCYAVGEHGAHARTLAETGLPGACLPET